MKIFETIQKGIHGAWEFLEVLLVGKTAKDVFMGHKKGGEVTEGGHIAHSGKSNSFGIGCEDELRYFLAFWKAIPDIRKIEPDDVGKEGDKEHKGEIGRMINVIGKLPEAAQSKILLIIGLREEESQMGEKKENPDGEKRQWEKNWDDKAKKQIETTTIIKEMIVTNLVCNQDGARVIQVFVYFLRMYGEEGLEAFLRNGPISEPAKRIMEAIDGLNKVAGHILKTAGIDEDRVEEIRFNLQSDTLLRKKRLLAVVAAREEAKAAKRR